MMTPYFEVPNLDDINNDERNDLREVFVKLTAYCDSKSIACAHRVEGRIDLAIEREVTCEMIYRSLPKWARW